MDSLLMMRLHCLTLIKYSQLRIYTLSWFIFILIPSLAAQQESLPFIPIKQLPQPTIFPSQDFERISHIEQEENGILWLATNRGLFSFDGTAFRKKNHVQSGFSAIDNGEINDIFLDRAAEKLWIAHNHGSSVLNLQKDTFIDYTFHQYDQPDLKDNACDAVFKDRQGNIWFGITSFGLVRLDTAFDFFPIEKKTAADNWRDHPTIYQIAQDATVDSILWLAASFVGLVRFNAMTRKYAFPTYPEDSLSGVFILTSIFPTRDKIFCGNMWGEKSYVFDLNTYTLREISFPSRFGIPINKYLGNLQSHSERIFWSRSGYGLFLFDKESGNPLSFFPYTGHINSFDSGFLATSQQFWLSAVEGLVNYDLSNYQVDNHFFPKNEQNIPDILGSVLEKEDGSGLWLSFQHSDNFYDYDPIKRNLKLVPSNQGYWGGQFIRLTNGRILFVNLLGIHEFKNGRLLRLPLLADVIAQKVQVGIPKEDSKGNLWFCSRWGGVYRVDAQTGKYENVAAKLPIRGIAKMFIDSKDNVYMSGNGFFVYSSAQDTIYHFPYQPGDSLTTFYPRSYLEDDNGKIWLSDLRVGGLMVFDPDQMEAGILRKYNAQKGPFSNQMLALTKDGQGRIWSLTKAGLQVFDPANETFRLFGEAVGLQLRAENASSNFTPAYLTNLSSGKMLVGYKNGFALFHPDSLTGNQELPKPYLISANIADRQFVRGKSFGNDECILLKHNENLLEFEFSSIAFREPTKVTYRYRLLGFKENWRTTNLPQVGYTRLPPGNYTFQLHAVNGDGLHAQSPLEWHFKIRPPWWATWWAYGLYVLLFGAILWGVYIFQKRRWRLKAQLEMEHREAERLKELDAVKTKLYTNITHEFRTPLTIILGMVEQIKDNPEHWYHHGLQMIQRSGQNLLRLVNHILDLSKVETESLSIHYTQGDIIAYLKYVVESFHSLAEGKDIDLVFKTDLPELTMDYDPDKMLTIVSNLLSNAIKFTPKGGEVVFNINNNTLGVFKTPRVLLLIKDTGIGIPPEMLPHIFNRFYQVEDTTTKNTGGTGVGLALTKELVQLLDGKISVESTLGEGTEFSVLLPISNTAPLAGLEEESMRNESIAHFAALPLSEGDGASRHTLTLKDLPIALIVEDNADVVQYIKSFLKKDYRIEVASNGEKGLNKALELVPDIVISDVMMPIMDGFELCTKLKQDMRTSHIPIILLTAKADTPSKIEGLERGADAYLMKPFNKQELLVRMQKLVDLRKQLQARYSTSTALSPSDDLSVQIEDAFMIKLQELLENHYSNENFGISDLCQMLLMSRAQLYRKISALTGQPAASYLRSFRLQKAKRLLQTTSLTVSEISFQVGFKDLGHFSRTFQKEFGENPSELRN